MKKTLQITLLVCLASLTVLAAGFFYAQSRDFFYPHISRLVEAGTGIQLNKVGPLKAHLLPQPGLTLHQPSIHNPSSPSANRIMSAQKIRVSLSWDSIFLPGWILDIQIHSADLQLLLNASGQANWLTPELLENGDGLPLSLGLLEASNTRIQFENQQTQDVIDLTINHMNIDLAAGEADATLDSDGMLGGSRFRTSGKANYSRTSETLALALSLGIDLDPGHQPSGLDDIGFNRGITDFPIQGRLTGDLGIRDRLPYGSLDFSAAARHPAALGSLLEALDFLHPDIGPVSGTGQLRINGSDLDLAKLEINHSNEQLTALIKGSAQNLLSEPRTILDIRGTAVRLEQILSAKAIASANIDAMQQLESLTFTMMLSANDDEIHLSNLALGFRYKSLAATIEGELKTASDTLTSTLEIEGETSDPNDLTALFRLDERPFQQDSPFNFSAKLATHNNQVNIEHLEILGNRHPFKASMTGELAVEKDSLGFNINTAIESDNFDRFLPLIPESYQHYLTGLGGFASASVQGNTDNFSIRELDLDLTVNENQLEIEGEIHQLPKAPELDLAVYLAAQQPIFLEKYFSELENSRLNAPLNLRVEIGWTDEILSIRQIHLLADGNDLTGRIDVDFSPSPARIIADIDAAIFSNTLVSDLGEPEPDPPLQVNPDTNTEDAQAQAPSAAELGERFQNYIRHIDIETGWINELDLDFSFLAQQAHIGDYDLSKLSLAVSARNGLFKLDQYELVLGNRPISLSGSIDTRETPPTYKLTGTLSGDTLEDLINAEPGLVQDGELNGELELESRGATIGELIENLNGTALVTMGPLLIRSRVLDRVSTSLTTTILNGIIVRDEKTPTSRYDCGVLGIELDAGVAKINRTFSMEARDYNLAGTGQIDLNTGTLDLRVYPKARRGLGFSLSSMVGGFRIRGNMATPDLGLGGGLLTSVIAGYALTPAVAAGAAFTPVTATVVATGIALTSIFDRITASGYSCENTLNRFERNLERKQNPPAGHKAPTPFF